MKHNVKQRISFLAELNFQKESQTSQVKGSPSLKFAEGCEQKTAFREG